MPDYKYVTNLIRVSSAPKGMSIIPDVIKEFNTQIDSSKQVYPGLVTVGPHPTNNSNGGPVFTTSRLFESLEELEDYNQAQRNQQPERQELVDSIHERCISINLRMAKILINGEYKGNGKPGVLSRMIFKAKIGKIDEVIRFLTSFVDSLPSEASIPQLSEVRTGPYGVIRIVTPYENIVEAELGYDRSRVTWESPESQKGQEAVEEGFRTVSNILASSL